MIIVHPPHNIIVPCNICYGKSNISLDYARVCSFITCERCKTYSQSSEWVFSLNANILRCVNKWNNNGQRISH